MSKAGPQFYLKLRAFPEGRFVDALVVRRDGAAHSGLLFGELLPAVAEELALALGLPVERESAPFTGAEPLVPEECASLSEQKSLFPE